jgi:putative oxidoreductase
MERVLSRFGDPIYALTRIVVGFLFLCHGAQKLFGAFGGPPVEMNALLWVAGVVEFAGGLLIAVGLFTGWAAFICSGQMAVAYFLAHQADGLLPIQNRGELAALYAWVFLLFATKGDGVWSLGAALGGGARD